MRDRITATPTAFWLLVTAALCAPSMLACGDDGEALGGGPAGGNGAGAASAGGDGPGTGGEGAGVVGVDPGAPVIFYTDLATAPANAYVTLWGNGFGDTQGSATVTLAGDAVDIVSWSMRRIEVKLPASAQAGDLVVTGAVDSPPVALGIHSGSLYFVSPSGDDDAAGDEGAPFQTLTRARDALAPGDVLYVREGSYTGEDNFSAVLSMYDVPPGSADAPVAIVGYPGETATIGDGTLLRGLSLYTGDDGPPLDYLVLAKLRFLPSCTAIELLNGDNGRFVGNEISGASDACLSGVIEAQGTSGWRIFGNYIHGNGNTKLEHGIYLGGYGTQADWDIGWNRIDDQIGGRAIQLFGHLDGDEIHGISIHDNEIADIDRDGIVLGATDGDVLTLTDVQIFNNVIVRAGRCVGAAIRVDNETASGISILHNTLVDNGAGGTACDQSEGEIGSQIFLEQGVEVVASNNLLVAMNDEPYVDEDTEGVLGGSNNLFFGAGAAPAWDSAPVTDDPMLVGVAGGDYHLSPGSPAIDAAVASSIAADHDGVARPQGAAADIGAYEWFAP